MYIYGECMILFMYDDTFILRDGYSGKYSVYIYIYINVCVCDLYEGYLLIRIF